MQEEPCIGGLSLLLASLQEVGQDTVDMCDERPFDLIESVHKCVQKCKYACVSILCVVCVRVCL